MAGVIASYSRKLELIHEDPDHIQEDDYVGLRGTKCKV